MSLQHTAGSSNSIRMLCLECYVILLVFGSGLYTVVCLHQARFVFRAAEQCSHDWRCHCNCESRLIGNLSELVPPNVCGVDRAFHVAPDVTRLKPHLPFVITPAPWPPTFLHCALSYHTDSVTFIRRTSCSLRRMGSRIFHGFVRTLRPFSIKQYRPAAVNKHYGQQRRPLTCKEYPNRYSMRKTASEQPRYGFHSL